MLLKKPRGMPLTCLSDNSTIDVMWYDDLPDTAFPDEVENEEPNATMSS